MKNKFTPYVIYFVLICVIPFAVAWWKQVLISSGVRDLSILNGIGIALVLFNIAVLFIGFLWVGMKKPKQRHLFFGLLGVYSLICFLTPIYLGSSTPFGFAAFILHMISTGGDVGPYFEGMYYTYFGQ